MQGTASLSFSPSGALTGAAADPPDVRKVIVVVEMDDRCVAVDVDRRWTVVSQDARIVRVQMDERIVRVTGAASG